MLRCLVKRLRFQDRVIKRQQDIIKSLEKKNIELTTKIKKAGIAILNLQTLYSLFEFIL